MEKQGLKKTTPEAERIEEIFTKLPDKDLSYWKTFYTKDLNSESEYLQKRAKKLLELIQEAEKLLIPTTQPPEPSSITPPPPTPESISPKPERIEITRAREEVIKRIPSTASEKINEGATKPPTPEPFTKTIPQTQTVDEKPTLNEWDEFPLKRTPQTLGLDLDLNPHGNNTREMMDLDLNPQEIVEQGQENKLVKSLSPEELKIVKEEMIKSVPLDFESEKTKTSVGIFLRNQMVKFVSGFNISEKMRGVTKKMRRGVLLSTGILVLWPSVLGSEGKPAYILPDNVKGKVTSISNEFVKKNSPEESGRAFDIQTYEKLPQGAKNIYLYAAKLDTNYVIVDKPTATMFVIGKDKKLMSSFPVLLGKTKGETPNRTDPNNDYYAGPHATTPAGKYKMGRKLMSEKTYLEYDGGRIFDLYGDGGKGLAVHVVYPKEYKERIRAINSPTVEDNRISWGCINITKENFDKYFTGLNNAEGGTIFITPDDTNLSLSPETGKIESQTLAHFQTQPPRTIL